mmetsp:Transcript_81184/g.175449  ORF Transcript_81184/g.175449 Transcript_81184/m.175449 type:complete len:213 (-) Transcript_81184:78-716(-)
MYFFTLVDLDFDGVNFDVYVDVHSRILILYGFPQVLDVMQLIGLTVGLFFLCIVHVVEFVLGVEEVLEEQIHVFVDFVCKVQTQTGHHNVELLGVVCVFLHVLVILRGFKQKAFRIIFQIHNAEKLVHIFDVVVPQFGLVQNASVGHILVVVVGVFFVLVLFGGQMDVVIEHELVLLLLGISVVHSVNRRLFYIKFTVFKFIYQINLGFILI